MDNYLVKFDVSELLEPMEELSLWNDFKGDTTSGGLKKQKHRILTRIDLTATNKPIQEFLQENKLTTVAIAAAKKFARPAAIILISRWMYSKLVPNVCFPGDSFSYNLDPLEALTFIRDI